MTTPPSDPMQVYSGKLRRLHAVSPPTVTVEKGQSAGKSEASVVEIASLFRRECETCRWWVKTDIMNSNNPRRTMGECRASLPVITSNYIPPWPETFSDHFCRYHNAPTFAGVPHDPQ